MSQAEIAADTSEIFADRVLPFTIPSRHVRGRAVRLDAVLDEILSAHDYPPAITHVLAEALVVAALVGSLTKNDGQMTMQAQTKGGAIALLVCDYRGGELRGYADYDAEALEKLGANPTLPALFGEGYLAITFDLEEGEHGRYQGIVPLEGETLGEACETYFAQSEQLPSLLRIAVRGGGDASAAGLMVQHLPDGEEGRERLHVRLDHPEWEHVAVMAGSLRYEELLDPALSMEGIVWRLFHEEDEIRTAPAMPLSRGCRCSVEHYRTVLARFGEAELAEMRDEDGLIRVDCAFCSKVFPIET